MRCLKVRNFGPMRGQDFVVLANQRTEFHVLVVVGDFAELHTAVQAGRLLAGEGILGVVAGEGLLIKHSGVTTEERPLGCLDNVAFIVFNWQTNVKHLTATLNISIISVTLSLAGEGVSVRCLQDILTACR